ncbi:unnamed protein product [Clavelina lepadiformis]|uniref:RING-type E3 ubiquitin transferase n=1 Tax=Clavelina lepadiformis TaxID=159417 RepID=A0ABP0GQL6_CLALP
MPNSEQEIKPKTQRARRSKTPRTRQRHSESEGDGSCVVCANPIEIYAVGHCNHYICFKCSTKIRLLCDEIVCPVCRKEMKKVIFTRKKQTFETLTVLKLVKDTDYDVGIYFADLAIVRGYRKMLEHKCPICVDRAAEESFEKLKIHLRKEHTLFYCEICLDNNNNFTNECKVYSRKDLARHRRSGDPDDTSHRGHPLCQYCDIRYLDDDKLFHHLRTHHYYCHICDAGDNYEFYGTYPDLRKHFKSDHFLCEKDACAEEEFTSVFSTELDFKAHCATAHKDSKSKLQQRMDRQIDLGFQYSRRDAPPRRGRGRGRSDEPTRPRRNRREGDSNFANAFERESDLEKAIALSKEEAEKAKKDKVESSNTLKPNSTEPATQVETERASLFNKSADFPVLFTDEAAADQPLQTKDIKPLPPDVPKESCPNIISNWNKQLNAPTSLLTHQDFPSLSSDPSSSNNGIPPWRQPTNVKKPSASTQQAKSLTNLKPKPTSSSQPAKNKAKHPLKTEEDFPALNPTNVMLVGRGTSKHMEAFQSFSSEQASSVKLVKNVEVPENKRSHNEAFINLQNDFPSLLSLAPKSSLAPPPGFEKIKPKPTKKQQKVATAPKLLSVNAATIQHSNNNGLDFPELPSTVGGDAKVRAPPGFAQIPAKNANGKKTQQSSNHSSKSNFVVKEKDFPGLPVKSKKVVGFSSESLQSVGTTLSFNPVQTPCNDSTETKPTPGESSSKPKNKKKQKGFTSSNPNLDFPGLPSHPVPSQTHQNWDISDKPQYEQQTEELPVGTSLNLANVFDFPSL